MSLALPNSRAKGILSLGTPVSPRPMAIYSLSHSAIGRTTHAAGTAGAHISYISRSGACREMDGERMPVPEPGARGGAARSWLDEQEEADRANARVVDKVMLALPRELSPEQRVKLVREFAEDLTQGRASWLAGIHDKGKDAGNPHAHLVIRDRDIDTGKRVIGLSGKGSTEMLREKWEKVANLALERAGHEARIDRRSLAAQGIEDRQPTKHLGPNVVQMERRWERQEREIGGGPAPLSENRQRIDLAMEARQRVMDQARAEGRIKRIEREGTEANLAIGGVRAALAAINTALRQTPHQAISRHPAVAEASATFAAHEAALGRSLEAQKRLRGEAAAYTKAHPVSTWLHDHRLKIDKTLHQFETSYEAEQRAEKQSAAKVAESKRSWAKSYNAAKPGVEQDRAAMEQRKIILVQENDRLDACLTKHAQLRQEQRIARDLSRGVSKGPQIGG